MAEEKNIKNYSAADIEKYWSDKLSSKEMHDMEKAAMDDPFLADALEGYQNSSSPEAELSSLKEKLESRSGNIAPVINLKKKKYPWLRVAAAIIIITGVGLLAQQLLFKKNGGEFIGDSKVIQKKPAEEQELNKQEIKSDTVQTLPATSDGSLDTSKVNIVGSTNNAIGNSTSYLNVETDSIKSSLISGEVKNQLEEKKDVAAATSGIAKTDDKEKELVKEGGKAELFERDKDRFADTLNVSYKKASPSAKQKNEQSILSDKYSNFTVLNNRYNYRVVDAQNNPVPFANVMNTRDNVGTYTDIRGNFNLVSSDSILDVQVRSLGYNSSNFKLVPSKQAGDIVLKEDDNARKQILADNRKVVSNVRKDSANYEEPEVGWGYYNTYVANNFQVPEAALTKNRGNEVELKFDIDKNGQPINIKITRSSQCKECDEEAIRLLKDGPKWKRKGRKSKGSVTIAVDK